MTSGAGNPWLERRVLVQAHQGGAKEAPSSTLFAMRAALAAGADAIELDVHRTADGHLVVCHDPTVDRTTGSTGAIVDHTLEQLRALDNAHWFVPGSVVDHDNADTSAYVLRGRAATDPELRIATLVEVLEAFPGILLNLDIKQTGPAVEPYEAQLAAILRDQHRTDDVIVASFLDAALDAFAAAAPEIGTSCGPGSALAFAQAMVAGEPLPPSVTRHVAIQVPPRFGHSEVVTAESVGVAHAHGMAVHVWTVDEPDEMERMLDLGVDGIITDRPSVLAAIVDAKDLRWRH